VGDEDRLSPLGWVSLAIFACALLALPRTGHVDDSDSAVYRVVVRNLVADGSWFELRYLPTVHPHFHEHLPFGFWPTAVAVRLFGEGAIPFVGGLETLLMLLAVAWLAQRIAGGLAGAAAFVLLATAESIFVLGPTARLDPLLLLLTTLSMAPFLSFAEPSRERWTETNRRGLWLGAACAALATLVKGPFGLLPWCCASAARAVCDRRWQTLGFGIVGAVLAVLPVAAFLGFDRWFGSGTWWDGYGRAQLFASAVGARGEGVWPAWYPLYVVVGRFAQVLPFALLGCVLALRRPDRELRTVALTCVLMLVALMLPARKAWNHTLIVFPPLAILGGVALRRVLTAPARALRFAQAGVAVLAVALVAAAGLGVGRRLWRPRCAASGPLHDGLARLPPGTPVAVVSDEPSWLTVGSLADELHLAPAPLTSLPTSGYSWALIEQQRKADVPRWRLVTSGTGWTFLERE
jgi:4-amino-4-deoxy-L-arabinose transferase-like glycosyltransferase